MSFVKREEEREGDGFTQCVVLEKKEGDYSMYLCLVGWHGYLSEWVSE